MQLAPRGQPPCCRRSLHMLVLYLLLGCGWRNVQRSETPMYVTNTQLKTDHQCHVSVCTDTILDAILAQRRAHTPQHNIKAIPQSRITELSRQLLGENPMILLSARLCPCVRFEGSPGCAHAGSPANSAIWLCSPLYQTFPQAEEKMTAILHSLPELDYCLC